MSNLIHDEARKPDAVTQSLKQGFEWTTQHSQMAGAVLAVLVIGLGGFFGIRAYKHSHELSLQEQLFTLEKEYSKKKEGFDAAQNPPEGSTPSAVKATGDLAKDYGDLPQRFADFAKAHSGTVAAGLAALQAAEIWSGYSKSTEAIEALKSANLSSGIIGTMVQMRLGSLLADQGDCAGALTVWSPLSTTKNSSFLGNEVKLRMGLCAEKTGDKAQAEKLYREVMANAKEGSEGKLAEQLIRLMKIKGN